MNATIHVHKNLTCIINTVSGNTPVLRLIGEGHHEVSIFLHDGTGESALEAITEAIRVFQMERAAVGVIEGDDL